MEILNQIYGEPVIGTLSLIATVLAWIIGILFILEGRSRKNTESVQNGLTILFFGSIPFLNGFVLALALVFAGAALCIAVFSFIGKFIAAKITGEENY